jgi:hypothetical protein
MENDRLLEEMAASEYAPSEVELLACAKEHVEEGNNASKESFRQAAEALAQAKELHGTTQASMAKGVGMSEPWVSQLLKWRLEGYQGRSPFGPTTKAGRVQHAKERAASGVAKPQKDRREQPCDAGEVANETKAAEPDAVDETNKLPTVGQVNGTGNADVVPVAMTESAKINGGTVINAMADEIESEPLAKIDLTKTGLYRFADSTFRQRDAIHAAAESISAATSGLKKILDQSFMTGIYDPEIEILETFANDIDEACEEILTMLPKSET